jgi:DNA helicase-2/ATP-dependent DNA helicase PcrA
MYDFDDMILAVIKAINEQDELRFNLQERYQYILLDEFQDTNPSQFELVRLIANHPVHEGRPNIMAVGDDDQAIFAFQGADVGNMRKFIDSFSDVSVVNLVDNYRSHKDIIHVAHNISAQIEDRLHHHLGQINKTLKASAKDLPQNACIERHEFSSMAGEYGWVGERVTKLINSGVEPSEIAVLAPRHILLEELVPFLAKHDVPVSYIKRENILETKLIQSLKVMAELILALRSGDKAQANQLFPVVLSLEFWQIKVEDIWKINWQYYKREETRSWAEIALENPATAEPVKFYLALAQQDAMQPLEYTLDALSGVSEVNVGDDNKLTCPLKQYYFSSAKQQTQTLEYYEGLSHLSVIRTKLREHQAGKEEKLTLVDFINLFAMYDAADESLINTHPIAQADSSVQLMTVYKAKGLEFKYVFILSAHNDVWGSKVKSGNNKVSLPKNLQQIRYSGSSEDELVRRLFVAITRAKHGLIITSHALSDGGKETESVKYLAEAEGISSILPKNQQKIIKNPANEKQMLKENIETLWQSRHIQLDSKLKVLLHKRLENYKMSPTHLNSFIDLKYSGPESFLLTTLLRFPQAPTVDGEFGTAIHNSLQWYQNRINKDKKPSIKDLLANYANELKYRYISHIDMAQVLEKGQHVLKTYTRARGDMFSNLAQTEVNFYNEGAILGNTHLNGKIDRLEIDEKAKTVNIADYKTGGAFKTWRTGSDIKILKYEQQLYFYKILIENSSQYRSYRVESGRLEFVEPNRATGSVPPPLYIEFDDKKMDEIKLLIKVVWDNIQSFNFPDTSKYKFDVSGSRKFINDLISD